MLLASFLPWLRSGTRRRSSYDLFEIVDRLGYSPDGVVGWSIRLWPLLPLLLVVVTILHWLPARRSAVRGAAALVSATAAAWSAGTSVAVLTAPHAALFTPAVGPWVVFPGAGMLAVATLPAVSRGSADRATS